MTSEHGLSSPVWLWRDFVFNIVSLSTVLTDSKPQIMACSSCILLHCENQHFFKFWNRKKMLPLKTIKGCLKADCRIFLKQKKTYKSIKKLICVSSLKTHYCVFIWTDAVSRAFLSLFCSVRCEPLGSVLCCFSSSPKLPACHVHIKSLCVCLSRGEAELHACTEGREANSWQEVCASEGLCGSFVLQSVNRWFPSAKSKNFKI